MQPNYLYIQTLNIFSLINYIYSIVYPPHSSISSLSSFSLLLTSMYAHTTLVTLVHLQLPTSLPTMYKPIIHTITVTLLLAHLFTHLSYTYVYIYTLTYNTSTGLYTIYIVISYTANLSQRVIIKRLIVTRIDIDLTAAAS